MTTLPFYYLSAFISLNEKYLVRPDPRRTIIFYRLANSSLKISALPNKLIISMSLQYNVLSSTRPSRVVVADLQLKITSMRFKGPFYRARSQFVFVAILRRLL